MIRGGDLTRVRGRLPYLRVGSSRRRAAADALAWIHDWGNQAAWAAAAVGAVLFFYAVVYAFPHAELVARQQEQEAIEQESHAFCENHGMPFGTREHTACLEDLMDIRANERQRTLADLGIF